LTDLRFGLLWAFRNPDFARVPWDELYRSHLDLVVESERMGFDHAWLTEHHFIDDGYSPSVFPIGGAIAARTERIRIGTFLLLLPLHNPVRIAEDTATLDVISEGRFDLGVGLGYRLGEFANQGISPTERAARLQEGLTIVRRLLSGETVTIDGKFTKLRDIRIVPPALQRPHPPIWVGGTAPKAIERAARMGFHYLNGGVARSSQMYDEALHAHGRQPQDYQIAGMRPLYVAASREQAWEIAAAPLRHMALHYVRWTAEAKGVPDFEKAASSLPTVDEIIRSQSFDFFGEDAIVGNPKDAIEQIEDYRSRGRLTDLVCALPLPGMAPAEIRAGMEMLARDVIPHFRHG
jgi:alkanesulfonate monooxygenase SsuD/methylene tetrahydromethanopterin reductase-like flavin-dependent oxidoreductase (luciferase family)